MNFPTSSIGLPQSLKYDLPPSFSDSARAYSVNVAPDGITQVTGPASTIPCAVGGATQVGAFNSQIVSFTIPSGVSQSIFLDLYSTTLSFTVLYTMTTAAVGSTSPSMILQGSAAFFLIHLFIFK